MGLWQDRWGLIAFVQSVSNTVILMKRMISLLLNVFVSRISLLIYLFIFVIIQGFFFGFGFCFMFCVLALFYRDYV